MAFTDQAALAVDTTFRSKVRVAVMTAAVQIMGESHSGLEDQHFNKRQSLAYQVILSAGANPYLDMFAWAVVTNTAITSSSTDSDIQFTVNSVWDDVSGVLVSD